MNLREQADIKPARAFLPYYVRDRQRMFMGAQGSKCIPTARNNLTDRLGWILLINPQDSL
jgi:hypothetical protein